MFPGGSERELTVSLPGDSWFGSILRLGTGRIQKLVTPGESGLMTPSPENGGGISLWDIQKYARTDSMKNSNELGMSPFFTINVLKTVRAFPWVS